MKRIIFGLGNPGSEYSHTRHNIGQAIIYSLVKKLGLSLSSSPKFLSKTVKHQDTILGVSTGYMNNSGHSVSKLVNYYNIDPHELFIIHDELDLSVGEWKIQFDRGPAGHNGIKSTIEQLGTQGFNRIRIGIGHPRNSSVPRMPVEDYVLKPFTADEKVIIDGVVDKIVEDLSTNVL